MDLYVGNGDSPQYLLNPDAPESEWEFGLPDGVPSRAPDELLINSGTGRFSAVDMSAMVSSADPEWSLASNGAATTCVAIHDMNNDGRDDIILGRANGGRDELWIQVAGDSYVAAVLPGRDLPGLENIPTRCTSVAVADLNVDGHQDIIFARENGIYR
eukprot:SAG31_NODE_2111_length_6426_cov_4.423295_3_plen_158_part_00